jgi:FAD:protein FMN transferase
VSLWAESETFACFGAEVGIYVEGTGPERALVRTEIERARRRIVHVHWALTRFEPGSGLSLLNSDPRQVVAASSLVVRLAGAAAEAGKMSGGLVDATSLDALEAAGYAKSWDREATVPLADALREAPGRQPARPNPRGLWRTISVDPVEGVVARPPGVRIDSGGLAKGLAADLVAEGLAHFPAFAVDAVGDIRIGGTAGEPRAVAVEDPFGGASVAELLVVSGAVATIGIGRRTWRGPDGRAAHHLLDPATGRPAFTGVVQATALAPTAFEAEVRAKLAVLAGPDSVRESLSRGGVVVYDDRSTEEFGPVLEAARVAA